MMQRGFWKLDDVTDERLVAGLKTLLADEGRMEARVVAHLAELDARRLHLEGAPSLFAYCLKELGLSENQAYFRIAAARVARRFPLVFELLDQRQIHVTSVTLLSKYLTNENHEELLREAQGLSKRELLRLLARRWPRPDAPNEIRKLPVKPGSVAAGPTGTIEPLSEASYCLQLCIGDALREKLEFARDLMSHANKSGDLAVVVERGLALLIGKLQQKRFGITQRPRRNRRQRATSQDRNAPTSQEELGHLDRSRSEQLDGPLEGHLDRSRHEQLDGPLEGHWDRSDRSRPDGGDSSAPSDATKQSEATGRAGIHGSTEHSRETRRREATSRDHIPHETLRRLVIRDGIGCSYVGEDGERCGSRAFLQVHHRQAWAKGGADTLDNLCLLCSSHNLLLAEREFGAGRIRRAMEQHHG